MKIAFVQFLCLSSIALAVVVALYASKHSPYWYILWFALCMVSGFCMSLQEQLIIKDMEDRFGKQIDALAGKLIQ